MKKIAFWSLLFFVSTPFIVYSQTESHKKAAEELLSLSGSEKNFKYSLEKMIEIQSKSNSSISQYGSVVKEWANKYLSWDVLKGDMIKIYTDAFTEKELKEIIKFYNSPIGKKLAENTPELTTKVAEIGQKKAIEHLPELQEMISQKMKEKKD